jgi:hypothetical protein
LPLPNQEKIVVDRNLETKEAMKARSTAQEYEQLVRGALVQLLGLKLRAGTSNQELETFVRECVDEATQTIGIGARTQDDVFYAQGYGSVLRTWHRDPSYLSPDGFPKPLAIAGKYGLRRLVERYYQREHYQRVLLSLRNAGLIRERPDGKWFPTKRCAVFPKLNEELLAHVAEAIAKLVQTVTQNVTSVPTKALFERSAKVRTFPVDAQPEFRSFVNSQASAFLSTIDDWLEAHALPIKARGRKTCTAGVFSFAFIDDVRPSKRRAVASGRGKSAGRRLRSTRQLIPQRSP